MYSPGSSPVRKRMRMSSPTYDEQVGDMSQEDINIFDAIEARLSQQAASYNSLPNSHRRISSNEFREGEVGGCSNSPDQELLSSQDIAFQGDENPFDSAKELPAGLGASKASLCASFIKASAVIPPLGFKSALSLPIENVDESFRSPSPEAPSEVDYSSWFTSAPPAPPTGFQSAASQVAKENVFATGTVYTTSTGFTSVGKGKLVVPSSAALLKAEEKMKVWQGEVDAYPHAEGFAPASVVQPSSPRRTVLGAVQNPFPSRVLDSPTPVMTTRSFEVGSTLSTPMLGRSNIFGKQKPFKSPLIISAPSRQPPAEAGGTAYLNSPLNPHYASLAPMVSHMSPCNPAMPVTPVRSSTLTLIKPRSGFRPLGGLTPRNSPGVLVRPKFVTPFKQNTKPSELSASAIVPLSAPNSTFQRPVYPQLATQSPRPINRAQDKGTGKVFDLIPPTGRLTLATSGFTPQAYATGELEDLGINIVELSQISPSTALSYSFHTPSVTLIDGSQPSDAKPLGPSAALEELHSRGCSLATKEWVVNHWPLILWKLAGMVTLEPQAESNPKRKRWCWPEVIRQLLYRYERDLNGSSRPPLRLITTRDAPSASPMVLCVSNVTWSSAGEDKDGFPVLPHPELEVTDGWYRLRARVDQPLARAIRKGHIRVGRKIAVAGAKLSAERKDGQEVLEAYESSVLILTGNSSHMAPWHAKLGFQRSPFIATFNSLTPDGGNVAVVALEVIKSHPIAYVQFIEDENGRRMEGPRSAKEESNLYEQWKRKREIAASKLWSDLEKRASLMTGYSERLEQRIGPDFNLKSEEMPDNLIDLYETLEESDAHQAKLVLSRLSRVEAGALAVFIREKLLRDREVVAEELERELQSKCPPREVRNFRVVVVKDAYSGRRGSDNFRQAQLTVWDVLNLSIAEGSEGGDFKAGQRFLVTNLMPKQLSAWMKRGPGSEVYLATTKNTRWKRLLNC